MKRVFGLVIAILAMAVWAGSAMADPPPPPGNSSDQSASISQVGDSSASATNGGAGATTQAASTASNQGFVSQTSVQVSDDANNNSSQSASLVQVAESSATAENEATGTAALTQAASAAANFAGINQNIWQFGFDGVMNDASQSSDWNLQYAGAAALAHNAGPSIPGTPEVICPVQKDSSHGDHKDHNKCTPSPGSPPVVTVTQAAAQAENGACINQLAVQVAWTDKDYQSYKKKHH